MLYQTGDAIPFLAQFTANKAGATGLTVTVAVVRLNSDGSRTTVVSAASATAATELDATNAKGLYGYQLPGAQTGTAGAYLATFHTVGTADLADVAALELVGPAWVAHVNADITSRAAAADYTTARAAKLDNLDAAISSRSTYAGGAVASVTGNVGGSVGSVVADVGITQAGADKVWASAARTLTGFGTLVSDIAAAVWGAASRTLSAFGFGVTVDTNNDKTGYSLVSDPPTAAAITDAVLDELLAGHTTVGSVGAGIAAAGAAGDPWATALPGGYTSGQAGYLLGHNLDVPVSTRAGADARITTTGPVLTGGQVQLLRGDAYQAERGTALVWTYTGPVDVGSADAVTFRTPGAAVPLVLPVTVSGSAGAWTLTAGDLTTAASTALGPDLTYYTLEATWADADTDRVTLARGPLAVTD